MASGKPFSGWISGEILEKATKRVNDDFEGNSSRYVVHLIKEDLGVHESPLQGDEHSERMKRLAAACHAIGLDPVSIMRATLAAVVSHIDESGGRLVLPIAIKSENDEAKRGAVVWSHLSPSAREALLEHVEKGDSWAEVLRAMGTPPVEGLHDLRLAYIFANAPGVPREAAPVSIDDKQRAEQLYEKARKQKPPSPIKKKGSGKVAGA